MSEQAERLILEMLRGLRAQVTDIREEVRRVHAEEHAQRLALEARIDELESERDSRKPLIKVAWAAVAAGATATVTATGAWLAAKFGGK